MNRALLLLVLTACPKSGDKPKPADPPAGRGDAQRVVTEPSAGDGGTTLAPAPPLPAVPASLPPPAENPRITPEAVAFGELLFHDPRMSADGSRSCATCHDPARGYSGGVENAANGKRNLRRTSALVNLRWVSELGWDGRGASMATYLPGHLKGQLDAIEASTQRIAAVPAYRAHIERVGGGDVAAIIQGLEAYALTRYEGDAPWDALERTVRASPGTAAKDPVHAGYLLFVGKAKCGSCHVPPLYTDGGYHRVALGGIREPARGAVDPALDWAYRTPTLRGAAARPAFFHAGSATSLEAAVDHYVELGKSAADSSGLTAPVLFNNPISAAERDQLLAFIRALTAPRPAPTKPVLP